MTQCTQWKTANSTSATDLEMLRLYKSCNVDAVELSVSCTECDQIDWQTFRRNADEAGIEIWSYHLPFADHINIAAPVEEARCSAVAYQCSLIEKAAAVGITRFIIHPSAEPISEAERPLWMASARKSLAELAQFAADRSSIICVEDLPRTCLGHTADEMLELLSADDRLRVCFDVNHLCEEFNCTHLEFVDKLGHLIVTTHMSDYDFVDEKHFFPGYGMIDWKELIEALENADYSGPFLYEGGFGPSMRAPEVPYGRIEEAHDRHMRIKELRGRNA